MKTPLYFLPSPFFNLFFRPSLLPPICLHPNWSICCLASLAESVIAPHLCAILLDDIMDVHMSSLRTLMHFYATSGEVYWGLTHDVVFCLYSDLISHTHTHIYTHKDTQHTQGPVDWHTHINIYLHQLLCAHSSYLYYIEWRNHWYQKFSYRSLFFSKIIHLQIISVD